MGLSEVHHSAKHPNDAIDLVFFVNVIPVATAELKTDNPQSIDDAMALGFALASKALDIKLITTVSGNVGIENVTNNTLKLLKFWNQHVPVARGAAEPLLRKPMDASDVHGASGMRMGA